MTSKRNNNNHDDNGEDHHHHDFFSLLVWSDRQRRILTANGKAAEYYTADHGYPFADTELPHYHLLKGDTHTTFGEWKKQQQEKNNQQNHPAIGTSSSSNNKTSIVGAWKRRYFYGGWEFSTDQEEECYNLQTHSLFIDLRLPIRRCKRPAECLDDLSPFELRLYARQHIFAGYTLQQQQQQQQTIDQASPAAVAAAATTNKVLYPLVCTRHHCIDWNFTGTPRNRPNKWWVEPNPNSNNNSSSSNNNSWKEWAYATDPHGQHYYCELWERLRDEQYNNDNNNNNNKNNENNVPVVALRRKANNDRDGVLIIIGDHFNFCLGRKQVPNPTCYASVVEEVDAAIERGDLDTARRWLSIKGGHGRISTGWKIDAAINYWVEGTALWKKEQIDVVPDDGDNLTVVWEGHPWEVFESNLNSADGLKALLTSNL